jgi:hypothetical protein
MNRADYRRSLSTVTGFDEFDPRPLGLTPEQFKREYLCQPERQAQRDAERCASELASDPRLRSYGSVYEIAGKEIAGLFAHETERRLRHGAEQAQRLLATHLTPDIPVTRTDTLRGDIRFDARLVTIDSGTLKSLLLDAYQRGKESR